MTDRFNDVKNVKNNIQKRKIMLLALLIVMIIAAGLASWWYYSLRGTQNTDDAYVMGNQITVSSQIAGSVVTVHYTDTDLVHQGEVLVTLDDSDEKLSYSKAAGYLANVVRTVKQLYIADEEYSANIQQANIALQQAHADYQRRVQLRGSAAISKEDLQHAKDAVSSSKAALDVATQKYRGNRALIQGDSLEKQPEILQASEALREAWIALQRTKIRSPAAGYIAQRNVQVGETLSAGQPLLSIVPASQIWIDANFKETQLSGVRIGQKVQVVTDLYGNDVIFDGKVDGISMGTGGAFSLLPAQNATGNWIKVVQRLPVRITLDAGQVAEHPLRIGLSANVTLKEGDESGQSLASTQRIKPAYHSSALVIDMSPVNSEITRIIHANAK